MKSDTPCPIGDNIAQGPWYRNINGARATNAPPLRTSIKRSWSDTP